MQPNPLQYQRPPDSPRPCLRARTALAAAVLSGPAAIVLSLAPSFLLPKQWQNTWWVNVVVAAAMFGPMLAAIAFSLATWVRIRRADGRLTGTKDAMTGVVAACLWLGAFAALIIRLSIVGM